MNRTERTVYSSIELGLYVDTIKHLKKAHIGPIKQDAPAMRTIRLSPRGWATGTARVKADRESATMVLMDIIVFAIRWVGRVKVGDGGW